MDPLDQPVVTKSVITQNTDGATVLGSAETQFTGIQNRSDELSRELAASEKFDHQSPSEILSSDTVQLPDIFQSDVAHLSLPSGTPTRQDGYTVVGSSLEEEPNKLAHRRPYSRLGDIYQVIIARWTVEALACAGSLLALFGIIAILMVYDGSSLPNWRYGITINSVIALFSTTMKALMLVAITACIGQAKWTYFYSKTHPLGDIVIYDSASRGPYGSVHLLRKFQARNVASLGALVTILALGLDPFVQQVISVETRHIASRYNSTLERAQSFLQWQASTGSPTTKLVSPVTVDMLGALYSGMYSASGGPNRVSFSMTPLCPTGNCTFPHFQSLAACHHCRNITDTIEGSCQEGPEGSDATLCRYHLPNGLRLNSSNINMDTSIATSGYLGLIDDAKFGNAILNFTRISLGLGPGRVPDLRNMTADECVLYWCVNTYEAAVVNGALSEKVVQSWHSNSTEWHQDAEPVNNIWLDLHAPAMYNRSAFSIFRIAYLATTSLSSWLAATLSVSNSMAVESLSDDDGMISEMGTIDVTANTTSEAEDTLRVLLQPDIDAIFSNLAASITRNVREVDWETQTYGDGGVPPVTGAGTANGTAWSLEVAIHVRWPWLIFPMALVVLSILFLTLTVLETAGSRVEVWKSSPVPLLANGLENAEAARLRLAARLGEMEKMAESIPVRLEETDPGWRLVR